MAVKQGVGPGGIRSKEDERCGTEEGAGKCERGREGERTGVERQQEWKGKDASERSRCRRERI